MPVSGLVITFSSDIADHGKIVEQLSVEPGIEIGDAVGPKLAIVVDTDTRDRDREIWQWVRDLPGVAMVDVAFVGFEETETINGHWRMRPATRECLIAPARAMRTSHRNEPETRNTHGFIASQFPKNRCHDRRYIRRRWQR